MVSSAVRLTPWRGGGGEGSSSRNNPLPKAALLRAVTFCSDSIKSLAETCRRRRRPPGRRGGPTSDVPRAADVLANSPLMNRSRQALVATTPLLHRQNTVYRWTCPESFDISIYLVESERLAGWLVERRKRKKPGAAIGSRKAGGCHLWHCLPPRERNDIRIRFARNTSGDYLIHLHRSYIMVLPGQKV